MAAAGPPAGPPPPVVPQAQAQEYTEQEEVRERERLRRYQSRLGKQEARLDFNKDFPEVNAPFAAKHDTNFILPDAYTTIGPAPKGPEFHGHYSQAMVGSTVPGFPDPRVKSVGLVNFSDLLPSNIRRAAGSMASVPHMSQLGDKLTDKNLLAAFRKLLGTGQQSDKDIDARELDAGRRGWRGTGAF